MRTPKAGGQGKTVIDLSFDDVRTGLDDADFVLVDVREAHEFAMVRIPGSLSMPLSRFDVQSLHELAGKRVVFSCAMGVRSQHALLAAQSAGLPIREHYRGGLKDWIACGGPVETGNS